MVKIAAIALALCIPFGIVVSSRISETKKQTEQAYLTDIHNRQQLAISEHRAGHHVMACSLYRQLVAENIGAESYTDELEQSCKISAH